MRSAVGVQVYFGYLGGLLSQYPSFLFFVRLNLYCVTITLLRPYPRIRSTVCASSKFLESTSICSTFLRNIFFKPRSLMSPSVLNHSGTFSEKIVWFDVFSNKIYGIYYYQLPFSLNSGCLRLKAVKI